jgi:D-sedoheptulose 7-phosphate isomerase
MNNGQFIVEYMEHVRDLIEPQNLVEDITAFKEALEKVKQINSKVILAGNGASASLASHYALDFTKQAKIRSICFNDAPFITAYSNDYGYEHWIEKAMEHHGEADDLVILISSSGSSPNVLNAAKTAKDLGCQVITLTGFEPDNPLKALGDVNLWVDSNAYNLVESVHALWLGLVCDLVIGKRDYSVKG